MASTDRSRAALLQHPFSLQTSAGRVVAARVDRPSSRWRRGLGLLARPPLKPGDGLWLDPCGSGIHTWLLRAPIDVVFLDAGQTILAVHGNVRPWRLLLAPAGTQSTLELPAAAAAGLQVGEVLRRAD